MILTDKQIRDQELVSPCHDSDTKQKGEISRGLDSNGYDLTLSPSMVYPQTGDPKRLGKVAQFSNRQLNTATPHKLMPGEFVLCCSVESIKVPRTCTALIHLKSTYARVGLGMAVTSAEPGYEGTLTFALYNPTPNVIILYPNEGLAHVMFFKGAVCERDYAERGGKYQNSEGVAEAKT